MAAATKGRFVRSLIMIALLIGVMWGFIGFKGYKPRLGLDLQGGVSVVLAPKAGEKTDSGTLDKAIDIIRQRIDALGVSEADITRQGNNVLIQVPGVKEQGRLLKLIGTTAKLRFRPVLAAIPPGDPPVDPKKPPPPKLPTCSNPDSYPTDTPEGNVIFCAKGSDAEGKLQPADTWGRLQLGPIALEGSDVSTARADLQNGSTGSFGWEVSLDLTGEGTKKFAAVTGKLACNPDGQVTRQLAIVLDRVVESHPQMGTDVKCNEGIKGGNARISGSFGEREARDLALVLKYGALPIELVPSTTTTVSPTLGKRSLRGGLAAGAIGLAIVFLYVLLFYRALGLIIWFGLAVHASLTLGVVILLGQSAGFALSLAGIAGLIVSLGIATDSFIVYFERIKDEVHQGKTVRASTDRAWSSAWRTILAADLVTALAAVVLYFLAVGSVRGFALMLGLSTALDLFVSRLFMHPSVWLLSRTRVLSDSKTLGMGSMAGVGQPVTVGGTGS